VILSLQNGVDNPERIARHVGNEVIPVLVYAGANIPEPGTVRHTGGTRLVMGRLGRFCGSGSGSISFDAIVAELRHVGLDVKISEDIEADLWTKLVMNCAYNAISALGQSHYARMVGMPEVNRLMRDAAGEAAAVAKAKGVRLPDAIVDIAMKVADTMPQTRSSTAQDIARGRPTEIAHINGYVVREGERLGIATPVNRTLGALIALLERSTPASSA
jgi:2-dehydropantoate 2-reductase